MWRLKGCPKCGGDIFVDRGLDAWYAQCLQCGFQRELADIREFKAIKAHPGKVEPTRRELVSARGKRS